ncbi:hypothetical protein P1J78_00765 [Psychromarinibacter sp. C21-152]|uniref:Lipoprotein n=1 Tax=Psychromarinibacter sediminicola TaxID=3033385 RepID=A0AAE3NQU0_9RHOB|nr:hypothetical protein [Psychromarinibacter sediminicola]MDF0599250.1 hypothetical protein [Psychromarinibacter sediminicola]
MTPSLRIAGFCAASVALAACGTVGPRPEGGEGPRVSVTARAAAAAAESLPLPLRSCVVVDGPVEIGISLFDLDGLAAAHLRFTGTLAAEGVRTTPGGADIALSEGGVPGDERVQLRVTPVEEGQLRTSVVLSLTTAAPHTGVLTVSATDRAGGTTRAGPFELAAPGGCADG